MFNCIDIKFIYTINLMLINIPTLIMKNKLIKSNKFNLYHNLT
jgi:hypothetical protein